MRVLLTGGAGFIGSHVAEGLLERGDELMVLDNLDGFYSCEVKRRNLKEIYRSGNFKFFEVNICDSERLTEVFRETQPETVIHLAARAGVRPSIENPCAYQMTNVSGTQNLLELCREYRVARLIFGSSSSVYGASSRAPFCEDQTDLRPISPYAATKLAGELLCHVYAHLYGLQVISLRFFTVYGPRQRPDLAIHRFTSMIEAEQPIPVFGDGTTGRDYTWCKDIVSGILAAIAVYLPTGQTPYRVYNLGNSRPVTLDELIKKLEFAIGKPARRIAKPHQPGDVPLTWADISKSHRELGYEPRVQLDPGLQQFVEWYRSQPDRRMMAGQ